MITTYLRLAISYIIEHFVLEAKRHYRLSFNFVLLIVFFVLVIYALYSILLISVYGYAGFENDWERLLRTIFSEPGPVQPILYTIGFPLVILSFGLYGSFVISTINDERLIKKDKFTQSDFLAFISAGEWASFLLFSGLIFCIYFVTYIRFTSYLLPPRAILVDGNMKELMNYFDHYGSGHTLLYRFLNWIDLVIDLIKTCLPYVFSALFIITVYEKRISPELIRKYKAGIIASLIAAASITSLAIVLYQMLSKIIIGFTRVFFYPPHSQLIPVAILFVLTVTVTASLNWAVAASFCLPIKMQADEDRPSEDLTEEIGLGKEASQQAN